MNKILPTPVKTAPPEPEQHPCSHVRFLFLLTVLLVLYALLTLLNVAVIR